MVRRIAAGLAGKAALAALCVPALAIVDPAACPAAAQDPQALDRAQVPADPLGSPMWEHHAAGLLTSGRVLFDPRVAVRLPLLAENQHVFPVSVDARALEANGRPKVRRIVLLADLNPIPVAVDFTLHRAAPFLATRIKLDQRTPVRALVQTEDGTWHVGGQWIDAAGGGCSAPPVSRARGDWADHLGEARGAMWSAAEGPQLDGPVPPGGMARLRLAFRHPMDTGLVENIPPYFIESLKLRDAGGAVLAEMAIAASVAEDPAFTVIVPATGAVRFEAVDTGGLVFAGTVQP